MWHGSLHSAATTQPALLLPPSPNQPSSSRPHPPHLFSEQVSRIVLQLLTDLGSSSAVKRQFLSGVASLCIFMMRQVSRR